MTDWIDMHTPPLAIAQSARPVAGLLQQVGGGRLALAVRDCVGARGTRYQIRQWAVIDEAGNVRFVLRFNRRSACYVNDPNPLEGWRLAGDTP